MVFLSFLFRFPFSFLFLILHLCSAPIGFAFLQPFLLLSPFPLLLTLLVSFFGYSFGGLYENLFPLWALCQVVTVLFFCSGLRDRSEMRYGIVTVSVKLLASPLYWRMAFNTAR